MGKTAGKVDKRLLDEVMGTSTKAALRIGKLSLYMHDIHTLLLLRSGAQVQ